jgi:cellulose biosynthesis protein BcsQ
VQQVPRSRTFIPLFPEPWNAASLERLVPALGTSTGVPTRCLRAPLTGLPFLTATGQIEALIDEWWRANVPPNSLPVLLMLHDPELPDWISELEAAFVIGITDQADAALYQRPDLADVTLVQGGPQEVTERALLLYGGTQQAPARERDPEQDRLEGTSPEPTGEDTWPEEPAPTRGRPSASRTRPAGTWAARPALTATSGWPVAPSSNNPARPGPLHEWDEAGQWQARPTRDLPLDPFEALMTARSVSEPAPRPASRARPMPPGQPKSERQPMAPARSPGGGAAIRRRPRLRAFVLDIFGLGGRAAIPKELTRLALAHDRGKVVGVISRAGGVGKTATAAALGIIFGEAVQNGWSAAVIDQNTGNPDQWGRLDLDEDVPTVSEIMADIEAGREWTIPTWGRTPALAVYPESRLAGDAYAPAQIERFANQLRRLHMLSVIDLPNRLPAFTSGEAAVSAGWICASDLLTIPTTDDPMRLQGVIELLDTPLIRGDAHLGHRPVPVIVAYLRSPMRAIRQSQAVSGALDQIRGRVLSVVEIPKDERATLAIVKGKPITEIDPRLRNAYIELALTIANALAEV